MRYILSSFIAILILVMIKSIRGLHWINYDEPYLSIYPTFDDYSGQYLTALIQNGEEEPHSPFITGYKYLSGIFSFSNSLYIIQFIFFII